MERFIINNKLANIMKDDGWSVTDLSKRTNLKRQTIINIRDNVHYNVSLTKAYAISKALSKSMQDVFPIERNSKLYEIGFTDNNIQILEKYVNVFGLSLKYQVYSNKHKVNVTSKYEGVRRVRFSGNFLINLNDVPKLELIDFDVFTRDEKISESEQRLFFRKILNAMVLFARDIGLKEVKIRLLAHDIELNKAQIPFKELVSMAGVDDEINSYLLFAYRDAYAQGFRLSYFETIHRNKWYDLWMTKRIV